jgi:hypothetical protein
MAAMRDYRKLVALVVSSVAASAGASTVIACDDPAAGPVDYSGEPCAESRLLMGLVPATPADYYELRTDRLTETTDSEGSATRVTRTTTLAQRGILCASARDKGACQNAYKALTKTFEGQSCQTFRGCPSSTYLVVSRGNEIVALDRPETVADELRPIDSSSEAALVAFFAERPALCTAQSPAELDDGSYRVVSRVETPCAGPVDGYDLRVSPTGELSTVSTSRLREATGACGRRPRGLEAIEASDGDDPGDFFGRSCTLERASVHAFVRLERELRAHGAPGRLVASARRSAREEARHTALTMRLATKYGARAERPRLHSASEPRPLVALAIENAEEGCAVETFGAVLAEWQARHAEDDDVARVYASLAADEARHAELSWQVHVWAITRLDQAERDLVEAALVRGKERLRREFSVEPGTNTRAIAGLPSAEQALQLMAALDAKLAAFAA